MKSRICNWHVASLQKVKSFLNGLLRNSKLGEQKQSTAFSSFNFLSKQSNNRFLSFLCDSSASVLSHRSRFFLYIYLLVLFCLLRQGLAMYPMLCWESGSFCLGLQRAACLCSPSLRMSQVPS